MRSRRRPPRRWRRGRGAVRSTIVRSRPGRVRDPEALASPGSPGRRRPAMRVRGVRRPVTVYPAPRAAQADGARRRREARSSCAASSRGSHTFSRSTSRQSGHGRPRLGHAGARRSRRAGRSASCSTTISSEKLDGPEQRRLDVSSRRVGATVERGLGRHQVAGGGSAAGRRASASQHAGLALGRRGCRRTSGW